MKLIIILIAIYCLVIIVCFVIFSVELTQRHKIVYKKNAKLLKPKSHCVIHVLRNLWKNIKVLMR